MTIKVNKLIKESTPEEEFDVKLEEEESKLNIITTAASELAKDWLDSSPLDYYNSPVDFPNIKYKVHFSEDEPDEHDDSEEPEEDSVADIIRKGSRLSSIRLKSRDTEYTLLNNYIDTNNLYSLLKYLIKSGYLSETSNCFNSVLPVSDSPLIEISDRFKSKITKESKEILSNFKVYDFPNLSNINRISLKTFSKDLETIITNIYTMPTNLKMIFFVNSQEELNHIIKECILRDIIIDSELRNNSIDFTSLRNDNAVVKLALLGDQLILINNSYHFIYTSSSIYKTFSEIKPSREVPELSTEDEVVSIDGIKYSKKLLEGMLECKIETLITNLQIEKFLQETESKRTGDGNSDSLQDIKLF